MRCRLDTVRLPLVESGRTREQKRHGAGEKAEEIQRGSRQKKKKNKKNKTQKKKKKKKKENDCLSYLGRGEIIAYHTMLFDEQLKGGGKGNQRTLTVTGIIDSASFRKKKKQNGEGRQ